MGNAYKIGPTANEATAANVAEARAMLAELGEYLNDFDKRATHNFADWTHAGDTAHVRDELLKLLVAFECHRHDGDEEETKAEILKKLRK